MSWNPKQLFFLLIMLAGALAKASPGNSLAIISDPKEAYYRRLQLISLAKPNSTILMEYYRFGEDSYSTNILSLLAKAARQGVQVHLIIDDLTSAMSDKYLRAFLEEARLNGSSQNLQIRVYNPWQAHPLSIQHRTHAKIFVLDNEFAMIGGRNLGSKYFGFSDHNYHDMDILVRGPEVQSVVDNFNQVFNSAQITGPLKIGEYSQDRMRKDSCYASKNRTSCESDLEGRLRLLETEIIKFDHAESQALEDLRNFTQAINEASPFSSLKTIPGREVRLMSQRASELTKFGTADMTDELSMLLLSAEHQVKIITPYLVLTEDQFEVIRTLVRRGVKVSFVTNSTKTTDEIIAITAYRMERDKLRELGVNVYEFQADAQTLHAKIVLIDDGKTIVGTFNFDPRSAFYNREIGLLISETPSDNGVSQYFNQFFFDLVSRSNLVIHDYRIDANPRELELLNNSSLKWIRALEHALPLIRDFI